MSKELDIAIDCWAKGYHQGREDERTRVINEILNLFGCEDWEVSAKEVIKEYKEQSNE